ncbi:MAG: acyclic terpene utilization AtuA family protein, partial [Porticoccaceae bacterium]|nr:acyclic terpene utilization AtuA family protein [Porticoccaceae bacterium]
MSGKVIRIAGASGFWGDATRSTPQLLKDENVDFIVYDYLAEITMSIMARARAKNPDAGYALDFVSAAMKPNLKEIARQGVRIVSNAGGVNPQACANALRVVIAELGLNLTVACILGDDMISQRDKVAAHGYKEMFSGDDFPDVEKVASINAYLGAFPVAR